MASISQLHPPLLFLAFLGRTGKPFTLVMSSLLSLPEYLVPDYRCTEDLRQGGGPEEEQIGVNLGHVSGEKREKTGRGGLGG